MRSHNRLKKLIDNFYFPALVLDDCFKVILANSIERAAYKWAGSGLLGKTFFDLFPTEQASLLYDCSQNAIESREPCTCSVQLLPPDKPLNAALVEMVPIFDPEGSSWNLICMFIEKSSYEFEPIAGETASANPIDKNIAEEKERTEIEEAKAALRFLLEKGAVELAELKEEMYRKLANQIFPLFQGLKDSPLNAKQRSFLELIESNVRRLADPFSRYIADPMFRLSPTELKIAGMIREGKRNGEMAKILNVSKSTILTHRHHVRVKLGLKNNKHNLQSYLNSFESRMTSVGKSKEEKVARGSVKNLL
jgi:DNA-binding CsgD family transcriptional regulator